MPEQQERIVTLYQRILDELERMEGIEIVAHDCRQTRFIDTNTHAEIVISGVNQGYPPEGLLAKLSRYVHPRQESGKQVINWEEVKNHLAQQTSIGDPAGLLIGGLEYCAIVGTVDVTMNFHGDGYTNKNEKWYCVDRVWVTETPILTKGLMDGFFERRFLIFEKEMF